MGGKRTLERKKILSVIEQLLDRGTVPIRVPQRSLVCDDPVAAKPLQLLLDHLFARRTVSSSFAVPVAARGAALDERRDISWRSLDARLRVGPLWSGRPHLQSEYDDGGPHSRPNVAFVSMSAMGGKRTLRW